MIYFIKMIKLNTDTTSYNIFIFSSYSSSINYLNHICFMSTLCWFRYQLHLVFMSFQPLFNLEELLRFSVCFLNMIILKSLDQVCFVCLFSYKTTSLKCFLLFSLFVSGYALLSRFLQANLCLSLLRVSHQEAQDVHFPI